GDNLNLLYAKGCNLTDDPALEESSTMFGRSLNRDNRTEAELRAEALAIAAQADIIVAAMGEASEMSGESSSKVDITIPDVQRRLLAELVKTGKPVVLVLFTGRPLTLVWEDTHVPAILNVWFGGSEAAYAIGDVLFGNVNPGGKLVATFPRSVGQIPLYYNHLNTGRPASDRGFEKFRSNYLDEKNAPLYPFGYGLSYTTFSYSDIELSNSIMDMNGNLTASVTVTNTGNYTGAEVVQLYIRDLVASIARPVKELKGFEKITLNPGESRKVSFTITPELLKFYNSNLDYVTEPGEFDLMIGTNSRDVKSTRFTLQ
ncbi:MAG: glycoside hydrolase family 3 C-terminal domain-containing protein, partial [Tannerellaceae bacterium]|nr:glycoside hydrolase family 3 C-terminal domain-containing protein [Tannerellaceae bacterium]